MEGCCSQTQSTLPNPKIYTNINVNIIIIITIIIIPVKSDVAAEN